MKIIPVENIMPNGNNRKNAGELSLIPSVKTDGILEPIIVYKEKGDEKFRIAAGHRRYASAKAYGIEDIPCIVLPKEQPTCYTDCEKGLSKFGEVCYFGGKYTYPSLQKREMSEKEKDLRDSLKKEEDWLRHLMEEAETHIGNNLYKSVAEALVKALEPFDDATKKGFESIIDDSLFDDESTMDLESKIIKVMFNQKPGRISSTVVICEIKANKDIKKLFKKYTDYMKTPPLNDDAYKLCLVAENIRDFQKEIDEESKEAKS